MEEFTPSRSLIERLYWLIKLRWIAVIGVVFTVLFIDQVIKLSLPVHSLYAIAFMLAAYNLTFCFLIAHFKGSKPSALFLIINRIANLEIALDLASLASLIHFSGGVENPFIFYFIFHMIIASILLSRRAAFLQATYAVFLFLCMVLLEHAGFLPHICLKEVLPYSFHDNLLYIFGISFVFISTLYIAVYMATSISGKLKERERGLWEANELLHEKDRIKSEYVLRVTHDIKEDLSAIQSCIEPVTEEITGPLNKGQDDLLKRAKERSKRLIKYVNALLNITKMKLTQELKLEHFQFSEIVKEVSDRITAIARDKNVLFKIKTDSDIGEIEGVRIYIQEAILNLLANAVKYTPEGGTVSFKAKKERDILLIQVEDTGIGIPKDDLEHVFEEFYRGSNARKQERQGTGLGLSIAKQIVEMHNGKIYVKSELNKGTAFKIVLPIK